MVLEADYENKLDEAKGRIAQAYYTAAFQRPKKLPKLEDVLKNMDKKKAKKEMTEEEMLKAVMRMNAAFGGESE